MANLAKWNTPSAWTSISFTAGDLNSLASGGGALGSTVISNSSGLDTNIDFSFLVTVGGTTVAGSFITVFLLPLNEDGSHYGDDYASSTTTQPSVGYAFGSIGVKVGITTGNVVYGTMTGNAYPTIAPGDYKVAFGNNLTIALNSTAALTLKYRTYEFNLNA